MNNNQTVNAKCMYRVNQFSGTEEQEGYLYGFAQEYDKEIGQYILAIIEDKETGILVGKYLHEVRIIHEKVPENSTKEDNLEMVHLPCKNLSMEKALRYYTDILNSLDNADIAEFVEAADTVSFLKQYCINGGNEDGKI